MMHPQIKEVASEGVSGSVVSVSQGTKAMGLTAKTNEKYDGESNTNGAVTNTDADALKQRKQSSSPAVGNHKRSFQ